MSQRLTMRIKKDGSSKGVAIRKNRSTTPKMLKTLFEMAYSENEKRKRNAKSKSQIAWISFRFT